MIILQYAAFLLPNIKICDYLHHCNTFYIQGTPSGGRILTRENRQWILLDTVYYHDCGSNLHPGIFNCNSSKLL